MSAAASAPVKSLAAFSQIVWDKHAANWPPAEDTLAEEFVNYISVSTTPDLSNLEALCNSLGIEFSRTKLPPTLRGHNCMYNGKSKIFISHEQSFPGSAQHTALHELRELLEYEFKASGRPTMTIDTQEQRADEFAIAVRVHRFQSQMPGWLDSAATIERQWPRWLAYGGLFLLMFIVIMGTTLLPHFEDTFEKHNAG